jgi:hypothetical protein
MSDAIEIQIITPPVAESDLDNALVEITKAICAAVPDEDWGGGLGGEFGYGAAWDSDVFEMRRFYWGDCVCGFIETADAWHEANPHLPECYTSKVNDGRLDFLKAEDEAAIKERDRHPWQTKPYRAAQKEVERISTLQRAHETRVLQALCREHKIPWSGGRASMVHCTCGTRERGTAWFAENDHFPACGVAAPNFRHKPSGFEVRWYKWIGRDMETKGDAPPLAQMLAECLADIQQNTGAK